jgi:hypothetical protein
MRALIIPPFEPQTEAQVAAQALLRRLIPGGQLPFSAARGPPVVSAATGGRCSLGPAGPPRAYPPAKTGPATTAINVIHQHRAIHLLADDRSYASGEEWPCSAPRALATSSPQCWRRGLGEGLFPSWSRRPVRFTATPWPEIA